MDHTLCVLKRNVSTGLDKQNFQRKIVNIFLPIIFSIFFGCIKEPSHWDGSKNRLIETVLLSTHNICFGWKIRKLFFCYALSTKVQGPELQCLLKAISHTHRNRTEKIKCLTPYERFHICAETETEPKPNAEPKRARIWFYFFRFRWPNFGEYER